MKDQERPQASPAAPPAGVGATTREATRNEALEMVECFRKAAIDVPDFGKPMPLNALTYRKAAIIIERLATPAPLKAESADLDAWAGAMNGAVLAHGRIAERLVNHPTFSEDMATMHRHLMTLSTMPPSKVGPAPDLEAPIRIRVEIKDGFREAGKRGIIFSIPKPGDTWANILLDGEDAPNLWQWRTLKILGPDTRRAARLNGGVPEWTWEKEGATANPWIVGSGGAMDPIGDRADLVQERDELQGEVAALEAEVARLKGGALEEGKEAADRVPMPADPNHIYWLVWAARQMVVACSGRDADFASASAAAGGLGSILAKYFAHIPPVVGAKPIEEGKKS